MSLSFERLVARMRSEAGVEVREGSWARQPESTIAWPMREDTPEEYLFWPASDDYFDHNWSDYSPCACGETCCYPQCTCYR